MSDELGNRKISHITCRPHIRGLPRTQDSVTKGILPAACLFFYPFAACYTVSRYRSLSGGAKGSAIRIDGGVALSNGWLVECHWLRQCSSWLNWSVNQRD